MKILILSAANSTHTVRWVNAFANRNHDVYLAFNSNHAPNLDEIDSRVHLYQLKYGGVKGYYMNAFELKKICSEINPDVINVHYASGYGTLARMARLKNTVLSIWGSDVFEFPFQSKLKKHILLKNVKCAGAIASTSNCMADQLRKLVNDAEMDITITPFGVDLSRFDSNRFPGEEDKIVIGNIKSLKPIYGISDFIQAAHIMFQKLPVELRNRVFVEIYGDGDLKTELLKQIEELGEENRIALCGKIPNSKVPSVLSRFSVFCATSHQESFGVSLIEAMAMKVPVVATDVVGFREVIEDGVTGTLVEVGNCEQIADALCDIILHKEKQVSMGAHGRKRVEQLYDWEKNVSVMEQLYEKMVVKAEDEK